MAFKPNNQAKHAGEEVLKNHFRSMLNQAREEAMTEVYVRQRSWT